MAGKHEADERKKAHSFKTWKLVSGILSIVFSVALLLQSCVVDAFETISESGTVSGATGIVVALVMLSIGIISIAVRNTSNGNVALIVLCAVGALIGFVMSANFPDLKIWSTWLLVIAVMAIISIRQNK